MYTNIARWFCKRTSGHDRVWPQHYNDVCPECGEELSLNDKILVKGYTVYHYECYRGKKPEFRSQVET
jgi:hypothetical protein